MTNEELAKQVADLQRNVTELVDTGRRMATAEEERNRLIEQIRDEQRENSRRVVELLQAMNRDKDDWWREGGEAPY